MPHKNQSRRKSLRGKAAAEEAAPSAAEELPQLPRPLRPTSYTPEMGDAICALVATNRASLRKICEREGMPEVVTVFRWLRQQEEFRTQYACAKEEQAEGLVDEILEIADDGSNDTYVDGAGNERVDHDVLQRSKLRVDARKWLAAKLRPKRYGDRIELTGEGAKTEITVNLTLPEKRRTSLLERRRQAMEAGRS